MASSNVWDFAEYRKRGKEMVDYIADYLENIRDRRVFPDVEPGYMTKLVPPQAPNKGDNWDNIMADVERIIMPGITHWQSPYMHAYFPALNCPASLMGDMLADGINCLGFTWASSPACTELEIIVLDWLAKMMCLPDAFLHSHVKNGGGVILTTCSEGTLVSLLAARRRAIANYRRDHPTEQRVSDSHINGRLIAYCSDQAHSSVEKAGTISLVAVRLVECDDQFRMRGEILRRAIMCDINSGNIPFYVCATLGTTGVCSFDVLSEIGPICKEFGMWLHIDAAYAGTAFICPEYRVHMEGVTHADSFVFNPSKWMMVHFDCTAMWVKNSKKLHRTFNIEPLYLKHENSGSAIDFMHWQIPLSRRFRALKLWFVLRSYGIERLQSHVRENVELAIHFEAMVRTDERFEIVAKRYLGLVTLRLKGDNQLTEQLLKRLNSSGLLHVVPALAKTKYIIRYTVTSAQTTIKDIERDWNIITEIASQILAEPEYRELIDNVFDTMAGTEFCRGLLLSNVPNPYNNFINGSFVAVNNQYPREFSQQLVNWIARRPMSFSPCHVLKPARKASCAHDYKLEPRVYMLGSSLDSTVDKLCSSHLTDDEENGVDVDDDVVSNSVEVRPFAVKPNKPMPSKM